MLVWFWSGSSGCIHSGAVQDWEDLLCTISAVLYFDWQLWEKNSIFIFSPCFLYIWLFSPVPFTSRLVVFDFSSSLLSCEEECSHLCHLQQRFFMPTYGTCPVPVLAFCPQLVSLLVVIDASRCSLPTFCSLWNSQHLVYEDLLSSLGFFRKACQYMLGRFSQGLDRRDPGPLVFLPCIWLSQLVPYSSVSVSSGSLLIKIFLLRCWEVTHLAMFGCLNFGCSSVEENWIAMACSSAGMKNVCKQGGMVLIA